MGDQRLLTEVPSSLKQLARLVVRGFYTIEDALLIDMLVRNPCMKEDDICELLKFERKMLRSRIAILKNDKFIQIRLKMETANDGKMQKVNYYFINYKTLVNVVKYKLDLMRKRMETEERDATSRASFKCTNCSKTFTDLEADQLFDFTVGDFRCTFCGSSVEEDMSALPKKDSRLLLAKFNEQLQPLYDLLREVEDIKLAQSVLEPEPVDIDTIRGIVRPTDRPSNEIWSGEATRNKGFGSEEARIDITIGEEDTTDSNLHKKERPVWMVESTVVTNDDDSTSESLLEKVAQTSTQHSHSSAQASSMFSTNVAPTSSSTSASASRKQKESEDVMAILLAHEKQSNNKTSNAVKSLGNPQYSDSSDEEREQLYNNNSNHSNIPSVEMMDEEDSDVDIPTVMVGNKFYPVNEINDKIIAKMTPPEKEIYIQSFQEYYSHLYD